MNWVELAVAAYQDDVATYIAVVAPFIVAIVGMFGALAWAIRLLYRASR